MFQDTLPIRLFKLVPEKWLHAEEPETKTVCVGAQLAEFSHRSARQICGTKAAAASSAAGMSIATNGPQPRGEFTSVSVPNSQQKGF